ncbi:peptidase M23-like protein [Leucobacter komagatae]|uniref:Peptidase M23-like protein n=1 Tax=Leucobacter komagatae TaxID=55969 RepID=A0A542Y7G6_9MICO|nr:M23 family metallopeptidase [Leucobacter komagatae]TQL44016.1 peptidase M23-like protein [Leucobacter komagatae]
MAIKLLHPVPGAPVTARFGWRPAFTENGVWVPAMLHNGTDYAAKAGTPIRAMHSGRVTFAGWDYAGGGNAIKIGSAQYSTMFLHMQSPTKLRPGDHVSAGQIVGYVGSTGMSTGAHLHAMLQIGGQWVDPLPYITATPAPAPKPKPKPKPIPQEDEEMEPQFIAGKKDGTNGKVYQLTAAGKRRLVPSPEWTARRAVEAASGNKIPVGLVPDAELAKIPQA